MRRAKERERKKKGSLSLLFSLSLTLTGGGKRGREQNEPGEKVAAERLGAKPLATASRRADRAPRARRLRTSEPAEGHTGVPHPTFHSCHNTGQPTATYKGTPIFKILFTPLPRGASRNGPRRVVCSRSLSPSPHLSPSVSSLLSAPPDERHLLPFPMHRTSHRTSVTTSSSPEKS